MENRWRQKRNAKEKHLCRSKLQREKAEGIGGRGKCGKGIMSLWKRSRAQWQENRGSTGNPHLDLVSHH